MSDLTKVVEEMRAKGACFLSDAKLQEWANRIEAAQLSDELIDALVVTHIYRKEHNTNVRLAIDDLISWHCMAALDPQVSSDAAALVERGRIEAAQVVGGLMQECESTLSAFPDHLRETERAIRHKFYLQGMKDAAALKEQP